MAAAEGEATREATTTGSLVAVVIAIVGVTAMEDVIAMVDVIAMALEEVHHVLRHPFHHAGGQLMTTTRLGRTMEDPQGP